MDSIRLKPNLIKCTINIKSCFNQRYILPITQVFNLSQLRIQTRLISMLPSSIFSRLRASHSGFKYCKRMMIFEQKSFIGLFGSLLDYFFFWPSWHQWTTKSSKAATHYLCYSAFFLSTLLCLLFCPEFLQFFLHPFLLYFLCSFFLHAVNLLFSQRQN